MQKKIYVFLLLFFVFVLQNTVMENYYQGGMPLPEVMHIGKTVSSDVSGNYLIKGCHQEMLKYLFPALVFNLLILVNIAFDQVLNFAY
jgi:uncharacterized membrane protein YoaK (UPF0700 family)